MRFAVPGLVLIVTLVGLALRIHGIRSSLWLDELHTSWVVHDGIRLIPDRAAMGNCTSAYFYLVWFFISIFGEYEWALRLPSALAGTALIPLAYWVTIRWLRNQVAAILSCGLVAVDPTLVLFSQEARVYAMLQLITLIHAYTFWLRVTHPSGIRRVVFVGGAALLFYLHYTAVLFLVAELFCYIVLVVLRRVDPRSTGRSLFLDLAATILLSAGTFPHVTQVFARRENWELFIEKPTLWEALWFYPLEHYVLVPMGFVVLGFLWRWRYKRTPFIHSCDLAVCTWVFCWWLVPSLAALGATNADVARLFFIRYLTLPHLALVFFASACCTLCVGNMYRTVAAAVIFLICLINGGPLGQIYVDGVLLKHRGENWREAIQWINEISHDVSLPLFVRTGLIEENTLRDGDDPDLIEYCLFPVSGIYAVDDRLSPRLPLSTIESEQIVEEQWKMTRRSGAVFLVRGSSKHADSLLHQFLLEFDGDQELAVERGIFSGVTGALLKPVN